MSQVNSFYSAVELKKIGLKNFGENVFISRKCSLYSPNRISLGSNVRIDDFCILSGEIDLGNYIHISAYSALFAGSSKIILEDFSSVSVRCTLFAESDDFSGAWMVNPLVPKEFRATVSSPLVIKKFGLIGSGSTLLPGAYVAEGTALGAMSLLKSKTDEWSIYAGVPANFKSKRKKDIQRLSIEMLSQKMEYL